MPSMHDTRVLSNLIRTEKDAQASFKAWTKDVASATSALNAWAVADSGNTQDLMDVSMRISQLMASCADSQRAYLHALGSFRASLKDVLARETSIRTVVRDREILVGRLMKLGNKKPTDSGLANHQQKVEDAQRELNACEAFLQDEEYALNGVKRRTFREALSMRMKAMGDLGAVLEDSSREAREILSAIVVGDDYPEGAFHDHAQDHDDLDSLAGDSIAPSHSASQAMSRSSSYEDVQQAASAGEGSAGLFQGRLNGTGNSGAPPGRQQTKSPIYPAQPIGMSRRDSMMSTSTAGARSPRRALSPTRGATYTAPPVAPRLGPIPTAPRPASALMLERASERPMFEIPKAPANVTTRIQDSSDEEDERAFQAVKSAPPTSRLRRQPSDNSLSTDRGGGGGRSGKKSGFFGGIANLFRKKNRHGDANDYSPHSSSPLRHSASNNWQTRTDRNVVAAQKGAGAAFGGIGSGKGRRAGDSSDEEDMPKSVIRVVNDPIKLRQKAMSDVGAPSSGSGAAAAAKARLDKQAKKKSGKASSDIGAATSGASLKEFEAATLRAISPEPPKPRLERRTTNASQNTVVSEAGTAARKKKKKVAAEPPPPVPTNGLPGLTLATVSKPMAVDDPVRASAPGMLRSNTALSNRTTTTTGTIKKKKKKTPSVLSTDVAVSQRPLPTARDLAASLPSASSLPSVFTLGTELPKPPPLAPAPVKSLKAVSEKEEEEEGEEEEATPTSVETKPVKKAHRVNHKAPTSGAKQEKFEHDEAAMIGTADWITHPPGTHRAGAVVKVGQGHAKESLMSLVEGDKDKETSRRYGSTLPAPEKGGEANDSSLSKRKSVRLAEAPSGLTVPPTHSPPSSIRSVASGGVIPPHGILVNHGSSPLAATTTAASHDDEKLGWNTRVSNGGGHAAESSDEDEEYAKARKDFLRGTKKLDALVLDKGKGRAT